MENAATTAAMPTGIVAFLFTDVEGSTALWAADPSPMEASLALHDRVLRDVTAEHGGYVFTTAGDSFAVAFHSASKALQAARAAQVRLAEADWPGPMLRVRMGLHLGEAIERGGDYFGPTVNLTARLEAAGHGGQVLISEAVQNATGVNAIDLGEHELRDVPNPLRIYQVGDGEFPPLRIIARSRTNLPVAPSRLIGRDSELAALREALNSSRLVTLTAAGGTGKTRLALAAGEELLPHRPGGVWFVDLSTVDAGAQVPTAIAGVVDLQLGGGNPAMQVVDYLAGIDALVIIDNCEHLVDACADFLEALLRAPGTTTILATTREYFDIDGEHAIRLPALATDDLDGPAVELFMERALASDSMLVFDDDDRAVIAELCAHLDGSPLAIELAASRSGVMSPTELLDGIGQRFEFLRGGRRRKSRQTLEDTLDWSYSLLGEEERRVLRAMAVFVGTFDRAAVAAVTALGSGAAVDLIDSLTAKSLVVSERTDDATRFRLLETPAAYAERLLEEHDETEHVRDRHLEHFLERTDKFVVGAWPTTAAREVAADRANLIAAIEWAHTRERWADSARLMFASYEVLGGQAEDVARLARRTIDHVDQIDEPDATRARGALAGAAVQIDDFETAGEIVGADISSEDPFRASAGMGSLAWLTLSNGDPNQALDQLATARQSLSRIADEIARVQATARIELSVGWVHAHLGDFSAAVSSYGDARKLLDELPLPTMDSSMVLHAEAMAAAEVDRSEHALELATLLDGRETVYSKADDVRIVAHLLRGDPEAAHPYLKAQALDAVTGRLSRAANDSLLFLALRAEHDDPDDAARLLMAVEQTRTVPTIATSIALADRLGVRQAFDESRARGREDRVASGRRAVDALTAELDNLGWA